MKILLIGSSSVVGNGCTPMSDGVALTQGASVWVITWIWACFLSIGGGGQPWPGALQLVRQLRPFLDKAALVTYAWSCRGLIATTGSVWKLHLVQNAAACSLQA